MGAARWARASTKAILCAANEFGIPIERISVGATETSKVPNNSCTGGSGTSENTCEAVILACQKLREALRTYREQGLDWDAAVKQAVTDGVNLSAQAWFHRALG